MTWVQVPVEAKISPSKCYNKPITGILFKIYKWNIKLLLIVLGKIILRARPGYTILTEYTSFSDCFIQPL